MNEPKHFTGEIDLFVADEGYGGFYDPDLGYDLSMMADNEDVPWSEIQQIEMDTAARMSMAYNRTLNIPHDILFDPVFQTWIDNAARDYQRYIANLDKHSPK